MVGVEAPAGQHSPFAAYAVQGGHTSAHACAECRHQEDTLLQHTDLIYKALGFRRMLPVVEWSKPGPRRALCLVAVDSIGREGRRADSDVLGALRFRGAVA